MKITPKYNIGDLVIHKNYFYNSNGEEECTPIVGWITDIKIYFTNNLVAYSIQWSDKEEQMLVSQEDVERLRGHYEQMRNM